MFINELARAGPYGCNFYYGIPKFNGWLNACPKAVKDVKYF